MHKILEIKNMNHYREISEAKNIGSPNVGSVVKAKIQGKLMNYESKKLEYTDQRIPDDKVSKQK